jgi:hypothetical protein
MKIPKGLVLTLLATLVLGQRASASASPCDPDLLSLADGIPNRYQLRGDRCEGLYLKPLSGEGRVLLASLTFGVPTKDAATKPSIPLAWNAVPDGELHIRAYPLRPRLFYQMDTVQPGKESIYLWPSSMLAAVGLPLREVGLVAWTTRLSPSTKVFHPLAIGSPPRARRDVHMMLDFGRSLVEVYIGITRLNNDGTVNAVVRKPSALRYGVYAAGAIVEVTLPELQASGLYAIQISGDVSDGNIVASQALVSL